MEPKLLHALGGMNMKAVSATEVVFERPPDRTYRALWYTLSGLMGLGNISLAFTGFLVYCGMKLFQSIKHPARKAGERTVCLPWAMEVFLAVSLISAFFAEHRPLALAHVTALGFVFYLAYHLSADLVRYPRWVMNSLVPLFTASAGISGLYITIQSCWMRIPRPGTVGTGVGGAGTVLLVALLLGWAHLEWRLSVWRKHQIVTNRFRLETTLLGILWLFAAIGLVLTMTRGAWLGFAVGMLVYAFRSRRSLTACLIVFTLAVTMGLGIPTLRPRLASILSSGAYESRIQIWQATLPMVRDHLLLGVGPGNYVLHYPHYRLPDARFSNIVLPHNLFLNVWAETGTIGLIAFMLILGRAATGARRVLQWPDKDKRAYDTPLLGRAVAASLCGILVHQMVDITMFGVEIGGLTWLLLSSLHRASAPAGAARSISPSQTPAWR